LKNGTLRVHPEFQAYSPEELAGDIIGFFAVPLSDRAASSTPRTGEPS
jgi:hypothetical protein